MNITKEFSLQEDTLCELLTDLISSLKVSPQQKMLLLSPEQERSALKEQIKNHFEEYLKSMGHGLQILMQRLQEKKSIYLDELKSLDLDSDLNSITQKVKNDGLAGWQILGLNHKLVDELHHEAVELYMNGNFEDASDAFLCLILLNHLDQRCWLGYGLSEKFSHKKNLNGALDIFSLAICIDETNPYPYIYCGEILAEQGNVKEAVGYLDLALKFAHQKEEHAEVISQIEVIKKNIKSE